MEGLRDAGEAAGGIGVMLSHGGAWPLLPPALMSVAPCATAANEPWGGRGQPCSGFKPPKHKVVLLPPGEQRFV